MLLQITFLSTGFLSDWRLLDTWRIVFCLFYTEAGTGYERYKLTVGLNWKPTKWLTVKPELQFDYSDGTKPFNKPKDGSFGSRSGQVSGGVSTVILF